MTRKTYIAFLCTAILVVGGCHSASTRVNLSPTHYTVSVMILDVPQEAEPPMGSVNQSEVEAMVKRRSTETTLFPTIHILPGETKEVENGETHSYPIGFDANGKPTQHKTVRDGLTMRSTLSLLPDHQAKLAIAVEDSRIVKWNKSPDGNKTPVCQVTSFGTTIRPKWGQWENVGKAMATGTDKGKVILVRIDKPNKQPSTH
jgi:hypothetical protein